MKTKRETKRINQIDREKRETWQENLIILNRSVRKAKSIVNMIQNFFSFPATPCVQFVREVDPQIQLSSIHTILQRKTSPD